MKMDSGRGIHGGRLRLQSELSRSPSRISGMRQGGVPLPSGSGMKPWSKRWMRSAYLTSWFPTPVRTITPRWRRMPSRARSGALEGAKLRGLRRRQIPLLQQQPMQPLRKGEFMSAHRHVSEKGRFPTGPFFASTPSRYSGVSVKRKSLHC